MKDLSGVSHTRPEWCMWYVYPNNGHVTATLRHPSSVGWLMRSAASKRSVAVELRMPNRDKKADRHTPTRPRIYNPHSIPSSRVMIIIETNSVRRPCPGLPVGLSGHTALAPTEA